MNGSSCALGECPTCGGDIDGGIASYDESFAVVPMRCNDEDCGTEWEEVYKWCETSAVERWVTPIYVELWRLDAGRLTSIGAKIDMSKRVRLMSANPRKPVNGKCSLCGRVGEAVRTGHKVTRDLAREGLPNIGQLCIRCWCGYLETRQTESP